MGCSRSGDLGRRGVEFFFEGVGLGESSLGRMGQSIGTLFGGNLNALGLGSSITADEVTQGINLEQHTAIVTGMQLVLS